MRLSARSAFIGIFLQNGVLGAQSALNPSHPPRQSDLDQWLAAEEPIAVAGVLANIGSQGSKVTGAADGVVVASPSKSEPDYFYTWTRDAALTIKALVDRFLVTQDSDIEDIIKSYISSQAKLQYVENPSGKIDTGGLGEPKFHVDLTAFWGNWGRPQRDGPALRATALIAYANYLVNNGDRTTAKDTLWPIITSDLQYVAATWNQTGFDLWEEVEGTSFFTLAAQHRSLVEGSIIASELDVECINCDSQAGPIRCLMQKMWNEDEGYMLADINNSHDRSHKGTNTFLASIHSFDSNTGCNDALFQPCSARALSNHKVVADSMRNWPINENTPKGQAISLGRYIEDVYMGGHPWYLTTSAAAEQLYYALAQWGSAGTVNVTDISLAFFQDITGNSAAVGSYDEGTNEYKQLTQAVRTLADGYLSLVQKYTPQDGSMAEQFSKQDGIPLSATDLTWSYASLLTAKAARDGHLPQAWGADGATDIGTCF